MYAQRLGAWYNNFGDLWGDITGAARAINTVPQTIHTGAAQVYNATNPPISNQLLVYGALGFGAYVLAKQLGGPRRNPPRRARRRR